MFFWYIILSSSNSLGEENRKGSQKEPMPKMTLFFFNLLFAYDLKKNPVQICCIGRGPNLKWTNTQTFSFFNGFFFPNYLLHVHSYLDFSNRFYKVITCLTIIVISTTDAGGNSSRLNAESSSYYLIYDSPKLLSCFFFYQNQLKFLYDQKQVFHRQTIFSSQQQTCRISSKRSYE